MEALPLLQKNLWEVYGSKGFLMLAVHIGDQVQNAWGTTSKLGVTFPVPIDVDLRVNDTYNRIGEGVNAFPLAYLIDKKGKIRHI